MARTKRVRRGYSAGEWGRNRVRVFPDPKTGLYQIEWRDNGRRLTRSLKHRDWRQARRQADEFAAGFAGPELNGKKNAEPEPLTLATLFDIYGEEVTPTKGLSSRQHDRAAAKMFLGFLERSRDPATLSQRDWDRFIRARRAGSVGPSGRPVSDRMIEYDLRYLISVLNWASRSRDEQGRLLLESNPLRGLKMPMEKNPTRVVLSEHEYQALLKVSQEVDWRFHLALVLAHETGHRIGAIRKLRWSDIDFESESVRWRARHEKTGYEHTTPVTDEALAALEEARGMSAGTGDGPVLPAPTDASVSVGSWISRGWWERAERLAGLEPKRGRGWHSLRRKFASDLMDQPLKVLCELGRLEDGQDRPSVLPAGGRGSTQAGARKPPESSDLTPFGGNRLAGIRPDKPPKFNDHNRSESERGCWIIELYRLLPGGWVTLQDIYRCTVDAELFGRKIGEARELADRLCPVRAVIATKDLAAHKEPLGEWGWEPVPGSDKAACQLDPALRDRLKVPSVFQEANYDDIDWTDSTAPLGHLAAIFAIDIAVQSGGRERHELTDAEYNEYVHMSLAAIDYREERGRT